MSSENLKATVSLAAALIALTHVVFPELAIDSITVVLLLIAVVPWLAPLFKSLEFPGGWKVEFQELKRAEERAEKAGLLAKPSQISTQAQYSFQIVANTDPTLALAGLRIELERRLVQLAEIKGIGAKMQGLGRLMVELGKQDVLTAEQTSVLTDLLRLLNAAVHGQNQNHLASLWALDVGPRLLEALDEKIQSSSGKG